MVCYTKPALNGFQTHLK